MNHDLEAILFDLDGVLVDSREAAARFFQSILDAQGYAVPSRSECDSVYHLTAAAALAGLSGEKDSVRLEELSRAVTLEPYPLQLVEPEPEAVAVLQELARRHRLGIVSSRIRGSVVEIVEDGFDLGLFEVIVGFEDTTKHKPDGAPLMEAARRLGVEPERVAYIGDSDSDVAAAEAVGALPVRLGGGGGRCLTISRLGQLPGLIPGGR
jgi:phosphoglycolate phosphatase-like HAD superfamily hydrolase